MTESEAIKEVRFNMSTIGLNNEAAKIVVEARDMAINALEKQIPKKPKIKRLGCDIEWWCPNCGENHILMNAKKGFEYCHYCGQKLKWND